MQITASAPGKTILMGEHAAVYARPALVTAVNRRLVAQWTPIDGSLVRLELPEVGVSAAVTWAEIFEHTRTARRRWQTYAEQPTPDAFQRLRGDDPAHLVKVALGEAVLWVDDDNPPGFELRLGSEIPIGAGFGSSAAGAVAILRAVLSPYDVQPSATEFERLALEIERRQHGSPSGVDTATVLRGGLVWATRDLEGRLDATPVAFRTAALDGIRVFNSGTPEDSTGAVVAAVRARRDADVRGFERLLERMEAATHDLRRRLEGPGSSEVPDLGPPIRDFEACLEAIGVVPPRLQKIIRQVEARGGAAKISGAGALNGDRAGSLLVYHPQPETIDGWRFLDELERLDVQLGASGARLEDPVND